MIHQVIGGFRQLAALILVLGLLLAACGDGDSDGESTATTADQPGSQPASPSATATAEPDEPEDPAPEFGTIDNWYNGGPTTLTELRGTPVLLVFWADF